MRKKLRARPTYLLTSSYNVVAGWLAFDGEEEWTNNFWRKRLLIEAAGWILYISQREKVITMLQVGRRGFEGSEDPRRWKYIWLKWALVILSYILPKINSSSHHHVHSHRLREKETKFCINFIFTRSRKISYPLWPETILVSFVKWLRLEAFITL